MDIIKRELKVNKQSYKRVIENAHGLHVKLFTGAGPFIVALVVTKELTSSYRGYMIRITHDEFKSGKLQNITMEDITCN